MRKILFLCTGNSCRSLIAEALANQLGEGFLHAESAGSNPAGYAHPKALATLKKHGVKAGGYSANHGMFLRNKISTMWLLSAIQLHQKPVLSLLGVSKNCIGACLIQLVLRVARTRSRLPLKILLPH